MKIIGVCGGSGAGKSSASKKLAEVLPNSLLIHGDEFMHEVSKNMEMEILNRMYITKDENIFSYNYYLESFDRVKLWIDTIEDDVSAKIYERIKNEGNGKDFIIIDWCFLPMCKLYNECNYTLYVKTDYEKRKERLAKRLSDKNIESYGDKTLEYYKPDIFEKRLLYTDLDVYGFKSKYKIKNDGNIELFEQNLKKIANTVINESNDRAVFKKIEF